MGTSGQVLREDYLKRKGISAYKLSKISGIPQSRLSLILKEKRRITGDTAVRLAASTGISAEFWTNLQNFYDLEVARRKINVAEIEEKSKEAGLLKD